MIGSGKRMNLVEKRNQKRTGVMMRMSQRKTVSPTRWEVSKNQKRHHWNWGEKKSHHRRCQGQDENHHLVIPQGPYREGVHYVGEHKLHLHHLRDKDLTMSQYKRDYTEGEMTWIDVLDKKHYSQDNVREF